ncbi:MAG: hypothetical protein J5496_04140 [Lachnospiraceae bacterium]|nr:hypothetical protein [Lachnospiraceae bacterium]
MGRRVQQIDTIANVFYVLISLMLIGVAVYSLIKGTLHYVFLIFGGAALYYVIDGILESVRGGEGAKKRGLFKLILAVLLAFAAYVTKACL